MNDGHSATPNRVGLLAACRVLWGSPRRVPNLTGRLLFRRQRNKAQLRSLAAERQPGR
ncbi:hypothetical protein MESS4_790032 [Mesorhizobium sp. STM 4661]|nr:hypothetical protein MESS4_790032 [Mesorhizobium sp. STM 4661]